MRRKGPKHCFGPFHILIKPSYRVRRISSDVPLLRKDFRMKLNDFDKGHKRTSLHNYGNNRFFHILALVLAVAMVAVVLVPWFMGSGTGSP